MKNIDYDKLVSPILHAKWRLDGIKKYLPARLDSEAKAVWNEFVQRSQQINSEADVVRFEHDLEKRFLANRVLRKGYWKRVFEEDEINRDINSQLSLLRKSIEQLEARIG